MMTPWRAQPRRSMRRQIAALDARGRNHGPPIDVSMPEAPVSNAETEPDLHDKLAHVPLKLYGKSPDPRRARPCEQTVAVADKPIYELRKPSDRSELLPPRSIDPLADYETDQIGHRHGGNAACKMPFAHQK